MLILFLELFQLGAEFVVLSSVLGCFIDEALAVVFLVQLVYLRDAKYLLG